MRHGTATLSDECRESGARLQKAWLASTAQLNQQWLADSTRKPPPFILAIFRCADGEPEDLIQFLRSELPIERFHREWLAHYFERFLDDRPIRGRPRNRNLRSVALSTSRFYQAWREENKRQGIKDHGQAGAMKEEAARFVVEELEPANVSIEAVLELLDRPKHRQN